MNFSQYIEQVGACGDAKEWVGEESFAEAWATCERGDWMLLLAQKANLCDQRTLTLMKGLCANTARPHMKDPRSIAAVDAAISYGKWEIGDEELAAYAAAAYDAAAYAAAAYAVAAAYAAAAATVAAAYAAAAAAYAAAATAAVGYAVAAAYAAAAAAYADGAAAKSSIQSQCAHICRGILPNPAFDF